MPATVYLATCSALPAGDEEDGDLLLAACAQVGLEATWQVWDDPSVDWTAPDLVAVRATWDYTARRAEFLNWAASVPRLANPSAVLEWNSDKRYLADLERAAVPVVATTWVARGDPVTLPDVGEYVVKPTVGAGSRGAARFDAADPGAYDAAREHIQSLHLAGRTVMVQPYLGDVDTAGETGLVYIEGHYSHAIRKGAMLAGSARHPVDGPALYVAENITSRAPGADELAVAEAVLAAAPDDLLYARVDLLPAPAGPVLVELELTEPSLFLSHCDGAAARLAAAIARRCSRR